jgi:hypothetical protein
MARRHGGTARRLVATLITLGTAAGLVPLGAVTASASPCTGPTVAAIGAAQYSYQDDVVAKLQGTCLFTQVDRISAYDNTPTLEQLDGYDAVLVYSDFGFQNNVAMGDVLADYVDGGGRVVVGALSFWTSDHTLGMGGRLSTGGYLPFTQGGQTVGSGLQLQADRPFSPYLANVTSFGGGQFAIQNSISLASGATQIAHWTGGAPLVAVKRHVVGLNMYPPSSDAASHFWDASTDGDILMANALLGGGVTVPLWGIQTTVGPGLDTQTKSISPGHPATFIFTITNLGNVRDSFVATGETNDGISVRYVSGRTDVTEAVVAGNYVTARRSPGRAIKIKLEVNVKPDTPTDANYELGFVGASIGDHGVWDLVSAHILV